MSLSLSLNIYIYTRTLCHNELPVEFYVALKLDSLYKQPCLLKKIRQCTAVSSSRRPPAIFSGAVESLEQRSIGKRSRGGSSGSRQWLQCDL